MTKWTYQKISGHFYAYISVKYVIIQRAQALTKRGRLALILEILHG